MDMSMDGSPFIDKTDIKGLFFNGGWCYGGFKATPASGYCYAHLLATGKPHKTAESYIGSHSSHASSSGRARYKELVN